MPTPPTPVQPLNPWYGPTFLVPLAIFILGCICALFRMFPRPRLWFKWWAGHLYPYNNICFSQADRPNDYLSIEKYLSLSTTIKTDNCWVMSSYRASEDREGKRIYALENKQIVRDIIPEDKTAREARINTSMINEEEIKDPIEKCFFWNVHKTPALKSYILEFNKKDQKYIEERYLPIVLKKPMLLYSNSKNDIGNRWISNASCKPQTFSTFAMKEPEKFMLQNFLLDFQNGKSHYPRVERKRRTIVFIHGPAGSGKTTLVSCIANWTKFSTYSFQPDGIKGLDELQGLIAAVKDESVLVFENYENVFLKGGENKKKPKKPALAAFFDFFDCWCKSEGPLIMIFTSRNNISPDLKVHTDRIIKLESCSFEQFEFLARLFQKSPPLQDFRNIRPMFDLITVSTSLISKLVKKEPQDTSPEEFKRRIVEVLRQITADLRYQRVPVGFQEPTQAGMTTTAKRRISI